MGKLKNSSVSKPFIGMNINLWDEDNPITLVKHHNSGRSADIWLGKLDGEDVAVKIYRPKFDDEGIFEQSIEREYNVNCNNSRIVSAFKRGVVEYNKGRWSYVLVMPFIDGECLTEVIKSDSLKINERIKICREIIMALLSLHESGILHGDLNPANIIVSEDGKNAHLVDFEFCLPIEDIQDIDYPGRGTPGYIAPEIDSFGLKANTFSADIWSLGWILAEIMNKDRNLEERDWTKFRTEYSSNISMLNNWGSGIGDDIVDAIRRCVIVNKNLRITLPEIKGVFDKNVK